MDEFKKYVILDVLLIIVWTYFFAEIGKSIKPGNGLIEIAGAMCGSSIGFCIGLLNKVLIKKIKSS